MLQSDFRNDILTNLTPDDFALVGPALRSVNLEIRSLLEKANTRIEHVYFPSTGIASVVAATSKGHQAEVGVIGRDGMTGLAVVLGEDSSPNETFIQVASSGFLISSADLCTAMDGSSSLHLSLCRYAHDFLIQTSRTALVNSRAKIEERLARWLLLVHDRTDENTLNLTHEFLSTMLGVRRPGVTLALHMLEYRGLIRAKRSEIVIVDRDGLVALTQGLYGPEEQRHFQKVQRADRSIANTPVQEGKVLQ
jgi:CRP-like cAMP-binding protein